MADDNLMAMMANIRALNKLDYSRPSLFDNPLFSDVKIRQINSHNVFTIYPAHKVILYRNSGWFRRALTGEYKDSEVIEMHGDDSFHFLMMMVYFYCGDCHYDRDGGMAITLEHPSILAGIYTLALKYDCSLLEEYLIEEVTNLAGDRARMDTMTEEDCMGMIKLHYDQCQKTNCEMGQAIVSVLVKKPLRSALFLLVMEHYPGLARDFESRR